MKKLYYLLIILSISLKGFSQPYGNEGWINYSQQYYKIAVAQNGMYRLTSTLLDSVNIPLGQIAPGSFHLYGKGQEQAIYVSSTGATFNLGDYIEFYGQKNDGSLDSTFYDNPSQLVNPNYSLITDTAWYFLTWSTTANNGLRMTNENDVNFSSYTPESYCLRTVRQDYTSSYSYGLGGSFFDDGEGWLDISFNGEGSPTSVAHTLNTPNYATNTSTPTQLSCSLVGTSNTWHNLQITSTSPVISDTANYFGFQTIHKAYQITQPLASTTTLTAKAVYNSNSSADQNSWAWISITYPHSFAFENAASFAFTLNKSSQPKYLLTITAFNGDANTVMYDLTDHIRVVPTNNSGTYSLILANNGNTPNCIITSGAGIMKPAAIKPVNSKNSGSASFYNFLNTTNPLNANYIIITNKLLWDAASSYATYRTTHGNPDKTGKDQGFNVILVDVDELYNQFGYGVIKHPIAIRNFCRYALKNSITVPQYLFLIGKSVHSHDLRTSVTNYQDCLVPSAGEPSSDLLLSWKINPGQYTPVLATGRYPALTSADVSNYLNKVTAYEGAPRAEWMKNILQFGGGNTVFEISELKQILQKYQTIWQDTLLGDYVQGIYKNSSDPIAVSQTTLIKQSLFTGTSVLNVFGHAASTGFDQDIGEPTDYQNTGKYPFIFANSCYAGDIHNAGVKGISEQWVMANNLGAVGFLGSVDLGVIYYLDLFSTAFIKDICYSKNYYAPVAQHINNAIRVNEIATPTDYNMKISSMGLCFNGDPALRINTFDKPDLVAGNQYFTYTPNPITDDLDSFTVHYVVTNVGKAITDTFYVQVKRTYPNGSSTIKLIVIPGLYYKDTISFKLPVGGLSSVGANNLQVSLDYLNTVNESNETNNVGTFTFTITATEVLPAYPYNYAIYPKNTVTLTACAPDPLSADKNVVFQIDTTINYTGQSTVSNAKLTGGIATYTPNITLQANKVYYWRVGVANASGQIIWNTSSFMYKQDTTGWSQADFYQFNPIPSQDQYTYMNWVQANKDFEFLNTPKMIHCYNEGGGSNASVPEADWRNVSAYLDNSFIFWASCGTDPEIDIAILDSISLQSWSSARGSYGQSNYPNCLGIANIFFAFPSAIQGQRLTPNPVSLHNMAVFIRDSVPVGDYIVLVTWQTGHFNSWVTDPVIMKTFDALGTNSIRSLSDNTPYILVAQKGHPLTFHEKYNNSNTNEFNLLDTIHTNYTSGSIQSTLIGPGKNWGQLHFNVVPVASDKKPTDHNSFQITPITAALQAGTNSSLILNSPAKITDYTSNPYLKLDYNTLDTNYKTPGQLKLWQVYYDNYADGAVVKDAKYYFHADTLQEGDVMKFVVSFKNISPNLKMDSILAVCTIKNSSNAVVQTTYKRLPPIAYNQSVTDSVSFTTTGYTGVNTVIIEFNCINPKTGAYDQLEQNHFNNFAQKYFLVQKDKRNPLLDVTFDGVHIMNGDIVSAKPEVLISMKDENKYFAIDDTSLVSVYLESMALGVEKQLYFSGSNNIPSMNFQCGALHFTPGTLANNVAKVSFDPIFGGQDGFYQLRVKGHDKAGNESGAFDYTIQFDVILKSSITNLINYPNPFTTATKFVFTLTGSEVPTDLRIQIFTISGKLVKEIGLDELGPIHIGQNITQYAWNGTDKYGEKLANGVYLYRVFSSINGNKIEHRDAQLDQYYKKGFGKMYLMR